MPSEPAEQGQKARRKRGPRGSGVFYFHEKLNRWACAVELTRGANGKRRRRVIYGSPGGTEADLKRKVADTAARNGGTLRLSVPTRLSDHMTQWLATIGPRLRPKTLESYEWAWSHASPLVGGVRLDRFNVAVVVEMISEMQRKGASANTIRHVCRVMQTAIGDAIAAGLIFGENPFAHPAATKKKPKHRVDKGRALSVAEAKRFIEAAREDWLEAAWILGLTGGLRIGECFGLKWSDVDFKKRTIFVQRQALFVKGKVVVDELKTADSLRLLPIGDLALDALRRRRAEAKTEGKSEWVFPSERSDLPVSPNNARRRNFAETVKRAKISGPFTPHDLRHSMNSFADAAGITEKVRSERLGHADSQITRRTYTHTIDGQARDAARAIDRLLRGAAR